MTIDAAGLFSNTAFKDKVIGISGAGNGIGKETARLLGSLGASLLLMDISEPCVQAVQRELEKAGVDAAAVRTDVGQLEDLQAAVEVVKTRWGVVHGWMNNAGFNKAAPVSQQPEEEFVHCWQVNALAAWRSLKLTLPLFAPEGGSIVNVSSVLATRTRPNNMAYASSKGALEGLTRAMATELAPRHIRANCIVPGSIHVQVTEEELQQSGREYPEHMHLSAKLYEMSQGISQPLRPAAKPSQVANLAAFLLSGASNYMTGDAIIIDGGLSVEMKLHSDYTPSEMDDVVLPTRIIRQRRDQLWAEARARGENIHLYKPSQNTFR